MVLTSLVGEAIGGGGPPLAPYKIKKKSLHLNCYCDPDGPHHQYTIISEKSGGYYDTICVLATLHGYNVGQTIRLFHF